MLKALIAQELLALTSSREHAESMAGDLTEEARTQGTLWFSSALAGVCLAMFFQGFGTARRRTLHALALGLGVWFVIYAAARFVGALLGIQPLVIDALPEAPAAALLYLGFTLTLANLLTGLLLGRYGSRSGPSPVMPLAVFWASAAMIGFCADVASGTSTWHCTLVYLIGVPMLYVAPLLIGGAVAAHRGAPAGLGGSR